MLPNTPLLSNTCIGTQHTFRNITKRDEEVATPSSSQHRVYASKLSFLTLCARSSLGKVSRLTIHAKSPSISSLLFCFALYIQCFEAASYSWQDSRRPLRNVTLKNLFCWTTFENRPYMYICHHMQATTWSFWLGFRRKFQKFATKIFIVKNHRKNQFKNREKLDAPDSKYRTFLCSVQ